VQFSPHEKVGGKRLREVAVQGADVSAVDIGPQRGIFEKWIHTGKWRMAHSFPLRGWW
jgi:hypothetical protein